MVSRENVLPWPPASSALPPPSISCWSFSHARLASFLLCLGYLLGMVYSTLVNTKQVILFFQIPTES